MHITRSTADLWLYYASTSVVYLPSQRKNAVASNWLALGFRSTEGRRLSGPELLVAYQDGTYKQVTALCRAGYYQLRQLRPVARSLPEESAKTLVQAFISSRLDYCNSLLYGISDNLFWRLQLIQNAAARFLKRTSRRDHISPVLRRLH